MYKGRRSQNQTGELGRVRIPRGVEVIGVVEAMLGGNKLRVRCQDDKMRLCRIPGRLRRRMWLEEGAIIIVEKWQIQGDTHGDAVWKYTAAQVDWLRRKGILTMQV